MGIPVTIGNEHFETKTAALERCKVLLAKGTVDDRITGPADVKVLKNLFYSRSEKVCELEGRAIVDWGRVSNATTICFAAILDDGSHIHFSFYHSIDALAKKQNATIPDETNGDEDQCDNAQF